MPGAVTATTGLLSLVYGITRAGDQDHGWGDPWTLAAIGAGGATYIGVAWLALGGRLPPALLRAALVRS